MRGTLHPMLRASRRSALRILGVLAACVWAWSIHAGQLHQLRALHAVCLEHAHLVDVPAAGPMAVAAGDEHGSGPTAWAASSDGDHGCRVQVLVPLEPPQIVALRDVRRLAFPVIDPLAAREVPRGPPLDYAPKTSPPAVA